MLSQFPIYPIFLSLFPVLALYAHNRDMVLINYLIKPIFLVLAGTSLLYFLISKLIKNRHKAALLTALFVLSFLSFGHYLPLFPNFYIGSITIANHHSLLFIYLLLFSASTALITGSKKDFKPASRYFNIVSAILVMMPIATLLIFPKGSLDNDQKILLEAGASDTDKPDIYFIVLDGYARSDILSEIYSGDNSDTINFLTDKGFYVATGSHSNYAQTYQSISSALNFDYLDQLLTDADKQGKDRSCLQDLIKTNRVSAFLKEQGYLRVGLPSSWDGASKYLPKDIQYEYTMDINEFDQVFINTTPLGVFLGNKFLADFHRHRLNYTFDTLPEIAGISQPTFTYAHIMSPHPPFLFDAQGGSVNPEGMIAGVDGNHYFKYYPGREEYIKKYRNQHAYVSRRIMEAIDGILAHSSAPPIIILQSDHGPGSHCDWENAELTDMNERFSILNAYYLPKEIGEHLYAGITPVNSFRLILGAGFGLDLPLLENHSYFSLWDTPYQLINIDNKLIKVD